MRATDSFSVTNAAAATYPFTLVGGRYAWNTKSTGSGTIDFKITAADGSTLIAVATQITATTGWQSGIDLPPGAYNIVISGFTANYVNVTRVPLE